MVGYTVVIVSCWRYSFNSHGDNDNRIDHQTAEEGRADDAGIGKGHLSNRLHFNRKDEIGELTHAMDQFADNLQQNVIFSMQQISEGNIDIAPAIIDDKDEIGPALNKMINAIGSMSDEISRCCLAALEGNLSYRADATSYQGKYQKIVQGFNDTIDAVMAPLNEASDVLVKMAHRDLSARIKRDYKGDYDQIKKTHKCGW